MTDTYSRLFDYTEWLDQQGMIRGGHFIAKRPNEELVRDFIHSETDVVEGLVHVQRVGMHYHVSPGERVRCEYGGETDDAMELTASDAMEGNPLWHLFPGRPARFYILTLTGSEGE